MGDITACEAGLLFDFRLINKPESTFRLVYYASQNCRKPPTDPRTKVFKFTKNDAVRPKLLPTLVIGNTLPIRLQPLLMLIMFSIACFKAKEIEHKDHLELYTYFVLLNLLTQFIQYYVGLVKHFNFQYFREHLAMIHLST